MKDYTASIWQGIKLAVSRRPFLGRKIGAEVVATCNAFLNLEVAEGDRNDFQVTKDYSKLTIKRSSSSSSGAGFGGWRGEYSPIASPEYGYGEMVIVSPSNPLAIDGTLVPGVYVCNRDLSSAHPYHTTQDDYDSTQWETISTRATVVVTCDDSTPPVRINHIVDGQPQ